MLRTFDEKVTDAVRAAMEALGLSVESYDATAKFIETHIRHAASGIVTDDREDD